MLADVGVGDVRTVEWPLHLDRIETSAVGAMGGAGGAANICVGGGHGRGLYPDSGIRGDKWMAHGTGCTLASSFGANRLQQRGCEPTHLSTTTKGLVQTSTEPAMIEWAKACCSV